GELHLSMGIDKMKLRSDLFTVFEFHVLIPLPELSAPEHDSLSATGLSIVFQQIRAGHPLRN
ncbi:MAG: hypothetical protein ACREJC_02255, partial [Tepidisphaeraceae bacterium]